MITFIDLFSGIGGFHSGLTKAGMTCVGWCEFDKFAQASYRAMYDVEGLWHSPDITKAKGKDMPHADVWAFGFPCQDISVAGLKKGIREDTRSGLFYQVMRLLDEKENDKPRWLLIENVRNLLSIDNGGGYYELLHQMAQRGYDVQWRVYNSKAYGVPQNRERVYIVAHLGGLRGREILPVPRKGTSTTTVVGNIYGNGHGSGRVFDPSGISPTLLTMSGGNTEPKIKVVGTIPNLGKQRGLVYDADGASGCLTASDYKGPKLVGIPIKSNTKQGYKMAYLGDGVDCSYAGQNGKRGRVQPQRSNTLTQGAHLGVVVGVDPIRIRKLTPRECWRLQGFTDEQFDKAAEVNSNSQLYKQAGNAVTVNVVYEIGLALAEAIRKEQDER